MLMTVIWNYVVIGCIFWNCGKTIHNLYTLPKIFIGKLLFNLVEVLFHVCYKKKLIKAFMQIFTKTCMCWSYCFVICIVCVRYRVGKDGLYTAGVYLHYVQNYLVHRPTILLYGRIFNSSVAVLIHNIHTHSCITWYFISIYSSL